MPRVASIAVTASRSAGLRAVGLLALAAVMVLGATQLWFLCDDAFITFRYVSNAHDGLGLVWNPPPFRPVEGYTGFSWALLLWAAWSLLGVEPPQAANWLSLGLGFGQFALLAVALRRLRASDGRLGAEVVSLLALAAIVTNRTFLQWLTSGLETSLFNVSFLAWVLLAFGPREGRTGRWLATWASAAALAALTRPDGLLLVLVTVLVAALESRRRHAPCPGLLRGLAPLLLVVAHVGWRRWFYGEWLPNTYYAKVTEAWPEAGVRFLACFVVEHGSWVVALLAIVWLAGELRRGWRPAATLAGSHVPAAAAVATVGAHVAYYTLVVGGDHFEYRVYSQLVPLGILAVVAMASRLGFSRARTVACLLVVWGASGVGWLHAWATRDMVDLGFRAMADVAPAWCEPLARWYDRQQVWLRTRLIGIRCQEHARFQGGALARGRQRRWLATPGEPYPVVALASVGYLGWQLPDAVVVDTLGLNDWVVARTPVPRTDATPMRLALRASFDRFDGNADGRLDEGEIRAALAAQGGGQWPIEDMVRAVLAAGPGTRRGSLDRGEFESLADTLFVVRRMAHDRRPPDGYVEAFLPNVEVAGEQVVVRPRAVPLTAAAIVRLEDDWRARVLGRGR